MAQTANPFVLKNIELILTKRGGSGAAQRFECQLTQAQLTPSTSAAGGGSTLETFCASYDSSGASSATWVLDLAGFQAWKDVTDFSVISFNDEGLDYDFHLKPNTDPTDTPESAEFKGVVTMVATPVGGTAKQYATFTASMPVKGKPTMVVAP